MSDVNTVQEAMRAIVHAGSSMSQQSNYVSEINTRLEEAITSSESIKLDIDSNMQTVDMVAAYFEKLAGILGQNELPTEDEESIKNHSEELSALGKEVASKFEEFVGQVKAAMETLESINEGCASVTDKADEVAGEISNLASK